LEKISRAIEILAHRAAPASIPRIETQAALLSKMGLYEQAQALFDETLSHLGNSDTASHWEARVELLLATGQLAVLQKQFPTSETDTASADTKRHLLLAQIALAANDPSESQRHARQALEQIQTSAQRDFHRDWEAQVQQILGQTLLAMKQPQQALIHLEQATEIFQTLLDPQCSPELADAIIAIGQCQLLLDQPDLAQDQLTRAQAIHATHSLLGDQYRRPLADLQAAIAMRAKDSPPSNSLS
jgi:tetratricopeptide (TPR) repeat protein